MYSRAVAKTGIKELKASLQRTQGPGTRHGKPFDWGFGGYAPDYLSLFSAAFGGKKRLCNSPAMYRGTTTGAAL
jgi:hypothetical protein